MRFLFVGPIHHHEEYTRAQRETLPGAPPPLFPKSQAQHYAYTEAFRTLGHEVRAFHFTESALFGGRSLFHFSEFGGSLGGRVRAGLQRFPRLSPEYVARNRRLLEVARAFQPDVIWLVGGSNIILPETLADLKAQGAKLLLQSGTSPVVFSLPSERKSAPLFDLVIANDFYHAMQWLELGAARAEALPGSACAPGLHRRYELSADEQVAFACDVCFVGTLLPANLYRRRVAALEALRDFDLGIWSVHPVPESLRPFYRGRALGETMLRVLCAAKIVINPHGDFMRWGGNMRLFEAAGCGVFQIADDLPGIPNWFEAGHEIVTYRDPDHLRELVTYYLANDDARKQIAAAGQARAYAKHTYRQRAETILRWLVELQEPVDAR